MNDLVEAQVWYNPKYNFIWLYETTKGNYKVSLLKGKRLGKRQVNDPLKYGNVLIGTL